MRKEYDFSKMKGQKNPYIKELKAHVTIRSIRKPLSTSKDWLEKRACRIRI